ncbi:hypothetical protein LSH36_132g01017 [Paralvinella palmiformis]|uniref:Uncharacterized protein n=1 Tax=Paralvinella palmiformis TaxID=53620 RepID=A0AAD9JWB2_9ANNE|nr:hypothetical protein LSH36_132g01017 [Paralvinella palmiformis]
MYCVDLLKDKFLALSFILKYRKEHVETLYLKADKKPCLAYTPSHKEDGDNKLWIIRFLSTLYGLEMLVPSSSPASHSCSNHPPCLHLRRLYLSSSTNRPPSTLRTDSLTTDLTNQAPLLDPALPLRLPQPEDNKSNHKSTTGHTEVRAHPIHKMSVHWVGLAAIVIFYLLILGVGLWAARKAKHTGTSPESEDVMLAGRNIGLIVGIFTMTALKLAINNLIGVASERRLDSPDPPTNGAIPRCLPVPGATEQSVISNQSEPLLTIMNKDFISGNFHG